MYGAESCPWRPGGQKRAGPAGFVVLLSRDPSELQQLSEFIDIFDLTWFFFSFFFLASQLHLDQIDVWSCDMSARARIRIHAAFFGGAFWVLP